MTRWTSRLGAIYRDGAIVVLSTLLLGAALEACATAALYGARTRSGRAVLARVLGRPTDLDTYYASLPYYAAQPWTRRYWEEHRAALKKRYAPYVLWRTAAFDGELLKVDENGIRRTPGVNCIPGAKRIFVFGGSVMWGWGSPDWATIPARLQALLQSQSNEPLCIVNHAEHAYVSSQNVVELIRRLEAGDTPAIVIFYDGVNDVLAARQAGRAMIHQGYGDIAQIFEGARHPLTLWAKQLTVMTILERLAAHLPRRNHAQPSSPPSGETEVLAKAVADAYLNNYRTVAALARAYGFDYHFFWQPHALVGRKPLTAAERAMLSGSLDWVLRLDPQLVELFQVAYRYVQTAAEGDERLHYLGALFDTLPEQIWIDTWGHVLPRGNEIAAQAIARRVMRGRQGGA